MGYAGATGRAKFIIAGPVNYLGYGGRAYEISRAGGPAERLVFVPADNSRPLDLLVRDFVDFDAELVILHLSEA